ncbi:MAG: helix-turn-helix domain-containing protein [Microcystis wesenbergii Mw_MB_S_20031200_S109D]|uniref:Helix-turn-helix domain-containing protein n=1 Tax=Microcystis wesenbergii Mw_MB_S_20031200_S109D TaxID=2486241 RepID=A0A552M455_9CHRO|nr:MAG: helix-turn-helix domain-containing protein [Microcystis wesenbergii Mw_MB_S_20031200_S109D]
MNGSTLTWTNDDVTDWLIEAAHTAHRLPPVRVQGYFNVWPAFVRTDYERMASDDSPAYRFPPSPAEIERMLVVMQWMQCLTVEQRKLVWMRAERWRWHEIGKRFGVAPRTAQRRWETAIGLVTAHLTHRDR